MATQIVEDEQAPVVQASSHAVLVVKPGPGQSNLPLIEGANVVGRQPVLGAKERAVIIGDPTVSARHATIDTPPPPIPPPAGVEGSISSGSLRAAELPPTEPQGGSAELAPTQAHSAGDGELGATQAYVGDCLVNEHAPPPPEEELGATLAYDKNEPISASDGSSVHSESLPPQLLVRTHPHAPPPQQLVGEATQVYDASSAEYQALAAARPSGDMPPPAPMQQNKSVTIAELPPPPKPLASKRNASDSMPVPVPVPVRPPAAAAMQLHGAAPDAAPGRAPSALTDETKDEDGMHRTETGTLIADWTPSAPLSPKRPVAANADAFIYVQEEEAPPGYYRTESGTVVIPDEYAITPPPKSSSFVHVRASPPKNCAMPSPASAPASFASPAKKAAATLTAAVQQPQSAVPLSLPSQPSVATSATVAAALPSPTVPALQLSIASILSTQSRTSETRRLSTASDEMQDLDSFVAEATQADPQQPAVSATKPGAASSTRPAAPVAVRKPSAQLVANLQAKREAQQKQQQTQISPTAVHMHISAAQPKNSPVLPASAAAAVAAVVADLAYNVSPLAAPAPAPAAASPAPSPVAQPHAAPSLVPDSAEASPRRGGRKRRASVLAKETAELSAASEEASSEKVKAPNSASKRQSRGRKRAAESEESKFGSDYDEDEEVELSPGRKRPAAADRRGARRVKEEEKEKEKGKKRGTPQRANSAEALQELARGRKRKEGIPAVLFTGLSAEDVANYTKIVTALGGSVVEAARECTHLITDKVRRTVKFLESLCGGKVITSTKWLDACQKEGAIVDPTAKDFQLHDKEAEHRWSFLLDTSLQRAREKRLLAGLTFWVSKSTKPPPAEMKEIIESGGGKVLAKEPRLSQPEVLIVTCKEDEAIYTPFVGFYAVTVEFVLSAILKQELDRDFSKLEHSREVFRPSLSLGSDNK